MNDIIKQILPTLATALGGPLAGLAVNFLADKLGVDKTNDAVTNALSGMTSDQLVAMKQMDLDFQKHMADNGIALQLAQIEVNKTEAASTSLLVSGWRPFLGWTGGVGIAYQFVARPMLNGVVAIFSNTPINYFGSLELQDLIAIVTLMLGSSAMRSYDKKQGTAN